jgi:transposase
MKRPRMDVNLEELDQIIERGTQTPLSASESEKLKSALHALAGMLPQPRTTEKTKNVLEQSAAPAPENDPEPVKGHGRNGASSYTGAQKVAVAHPTLHAGDPCPGCEKGKVYPQKEPRTLVRIVGQAPLAATVYELDRLRCNLCGEVFTAPEPEGIGPEKYDDTTAAMIALLKYGSGMPFYRLEKLEQALGIPLPASTQWEIVEDQAELIQAARDELIRQAAQGEVLHNDDTSMRVLRMAREPSPMVKADRTGVFTSGIVSTQQGRRIALYFTGRQHAGENLRDVLQHRSADLAPPLQMCDALSRNTPKLSDGAEILLANCLAHGRRQFVEVAANFPEPCRYVLETLGDVYKYDAEGRSAQLSPPDRLQFHQQHSGPVMEQLHQWLEAQFALKQVEPNSGLGKAITYLLRHWKGLTAFLREAGAPLDNNICERALKRAVLHRKNALFYRTLHGAEAGDLFMSLIHTCELAGANPFDYLTQLQRHASELAANPSAWMPWNYLDQTQPGHNH